MAITRRIFDAVLEGGAPYRERVGLGYWLKSDWLVVERIRYGDASGPLFSGRCGGVELH